MRLLICAGGTGGGVYPALAVLRALQALDGQDLDADEIPAGSAFGQDQQGVVWVGGEGGIEVELLSRENVPFKTIPAARPVGSHRKRRRRPESRH